MSVITEEVKSILINTVLSEQNKQVCLDRLEQEHNVKISVWSNDMGSFMSVENLENGGA